MANLEAVFGREEIAYVLFEELFEPGTVKSICDFLGIDAHEPDLDRRVNDSPKTEDHRLPEQVARRVVDHYRTTYEAVADRLGPDVVLHRWPSARMLDR